MLGAFVIAWKQELLGGILMLVAYLVLSFSLSVHSLFYEKEPSFHFRIFYLASPFLVSGILFIIAARLTRSVLKLERKDITGKLRYFHQ